MPKHVYEGTDIAKNPANKKLVGTGPFKFAEYKPGEYYLLKRNDAYWDKDEPLSTRSSTGCCPTAPRPACAGGRARSSSPPSRPCRSPISTASPRCRASRSMPKGYEGLTYQLVVEINHRRKELADLKVRQAIAHAIDQDFVVKTIFLGYAKPSTGPVPHYDKSSTRPTCRPTLSIAKANALLDEAGYQTRRRRHPLHAEAAAGALFQRDQAVRRLSAPGAGRDRHRRRRSSTTTRRRTSRRSTPTTPSTSRSRRRSSAAIRRSRPPSWSRAACRTACPSPTRAATPTPTSTR